jgi:ubiquinone/menaquinone biosynthesis C-methylase UbiE
MKKNFHELSYKLHSKLYSSKSSKDLDLYRHWFENGTVDLWRHMRMFEVLNPFLAHYKGATWLALADGYFGTASTYINNRGGDALPIDIDTSLLEIAKENNLITSFEKGNAEKLRFEDQSFDFVFCKESFHHFPRPYIALYEMLRVAKKAVILVEPKDWNPPPLPRGILIKLKNMLRKLLGKKIPFADSGNYEPVGNYVFAISEREIQKIAMGIGLRKVAFKSFHDIYIQGVEYEKADENSVLLKKIKSGIKKNELLSRLGLTSKNSINTILFVDDIKKEVLHELHTMKFDLVDLPENPYANSSEAISK